MLTYVALMTLAAGLLIAALGVPMWLGRVPPNPLYGARLRKSFESPDLWYRINRRAGGYFVAAGAVVALGGVAGLLWPRPAPPAVLVAMAGVPLVPVLAAAAATWRYARSL